MLRIEVMSGPQDGQVVFSASGSTRIGRSADCDLVLSHDPRVPEGGAVLSWERGEIMLESENERRAIVPGELFRVGVTSLRVSSD